MPIYSVPKPIREEEDYRAKCVEIASKIVCWQSRYRCAMCGRLGNEEEICCHHIVYRSFGNTTALLENLLPVCAICHSDIHHDEKRFKAWLEMSRPGLYEKLWAIAREFCNIVWEDLYCSLLEQYKQLLQAMAQKAPYFSTGMNASIC